MDINLNNLVVDPVVIRWGITVVAIVLAVVASYVLLMWGGAKGAEKWRIIKGEIPAVIEQLDEPADVIPHWVDKQLDQILIAKWDEAIVKYAPDLIKQVEKLIDERLEAVPPVEVNLSQ